MAPGNCLYSLSTGVSRAVFFVPWQEWTVYNSQHFTPSSISLTSPASLSSYCLIFTFPLQQNSLKLWKSWTHSSAISLFLLYHEFTFMRLSPPSLHLALSKSSVTTSLGPVVSCQSSTNVNHQQHLTQLSFLTSLHFSSWIPGSHIAWFSSKLMCSFFPFFLLVPPHLPAFLKTEPWDPWASRLSLYSLPGWCHHPGSQLSILSVC